MKTMILKLDDDTAKELAKYPNMSETLRESFRVYNGAISTDTLAAMRTAFERLRTNQETLGERFDLMYEMVEKMYLFLEEMKGR